MHEIVTVEQVNAVFLLLAVGLPVLGLLLGAGLGKHQHQVLRGALKGLLIGLLGPLNLLLWKTYNVLTDRFGLDSIKNLFINLALFVILGIVAGVLFAKFWHRHPHSASGGDGGALIGAVATGPAPAGAPGAAKPLEQADEPPRDA